MTMTSLQRINKNSIKNIEKTILSHPSFIASESEIICQLIGGSILYGLNTPDSDVDYRGLFVAKNKKYIAGFETIESIVQSEEIDATYYELARYLKLLRKSNTQVLEILFAPTDSFTYMSDLFQKIRQHRYDFIDSNILKKSLQGYIYSEMRLATGERSGQLGGKRKEAVIKYGFSPKNFVQIFRLCKVGQHLFSTGQYIVNIQQSLPSYHEFLMDIKLHPEKYTCNQLKAEVESEYRRLLEAMDNSKIDYKFNVDLASEIVLESRKEL